MAKTLELPGYKVLNNLNSRQIPKRKIDVKKLVTIKDLKLIRVKNTVSLETKKVKLSFHIYMGG